MAVIQVRDGSRFDQEGSSGGREKWRNSGYSPEAE